MPYAAQSAILIPSLYVDIVNSKQLIYNAFHNLTLFVYQVYHILHWSNKVSDVCGLHHNINTHSNDNSNTLMNLLEEVPDRLFSTTM